MEFNNLFKLIQLLFLLFLRCLSVEATLLKPQFSTIIYFRPFTVHRQLLQFIDTSFTLKKNEA